MHNRANVIIIMLYIGLGLKIHLSFSCVALNPHLWALNLNTLALLVLFYR